MVWAVRDEHAACETAVVHPRALDPFLDAAVTAYETCTPEEPPSCFAMLVGELVGGTALVHDIAFGRNVRATAPAATSEFRTNIVPRFGPAYDNAHRGFWCDSRDLLRIHRRADARGMDILGSIHLHPDWHRIGPPDERGLRISQAPTPMDAYMFDSTRWPVNIICYLERPGDELHYALGAWGPPAASETACPPIDIQFRLGR